MKYFFRPLHKHLWIEPLRQEKQSQLIPDELIEEKPFSVVRVLDYSNDSVIPFKLNSLLVVRTEGIEIISFEDQKFKIIPEHFVVGEINECSLCKSESKEEK